MPGNTIDIAGIVQSSGPIGSINMKDGSTKPKREVTVYDNTKHSVSVTCWGDMA